MPMLNKKGKGKKMPIECYRDLLGQADNDELRQGQAWYLNVNREVNRLSVETGYSLEICAGVIAVLSPMVEWNLNFKIAKRFLKSKGKIKGAGFPINYRKAREVLKGNLDVIRGPKVKRFFRMLLDPIFDEAVIDTHMIAAFFKGIAYRDDFKVISQSEKRLAPIREAIKTIANERKESVGQVQATIWITFKRLNGEYAMQLKLWN